MSFTEIVQHTGEMLDHIRSQPINWDLAITWIVIVAVGCWLWAEFIEFLEGRRMRRRFARPSDLTAETQLAGTDRGLK
jgi:hypothetical protein